MKRTPLPLILAASLAACTSTSTSEPAPVASAARTASATATTPPLAPSGSAPAPVASFDPMARIGSGPKDVPEVVPGVSIGPIKLGMTRAELKTLGYVAGPITSEYDDGSVISVNPYSIVLQSDKVESIAANLTLMPRGLRIRGTVLSPQSKLAQAAAWFDDCGPVRSRLGGFSFRCEGKRLLVRKGGGSGQIQVQIFARPDLDPGEEGGAPGADSGDALDAGAPRTGDLGLIGYGSTGGTGEAVNILDNPDHRPGDPASRGISIVGAMPRDVVDRVVRQQYGGFNACYKQAQSRSPAVRGIVHVRFTIGPDGAVTTADIDPSLTDVHDPAMIACVLKVYLKLAFPNPKGAVILVGIPLLFAPPLVAPAVRARSAAP